MKPSKHFSKTVLDWFDDHGRKDLPWQQKKSAYRIWVSEIMLQQTQVKTVIPYFQRFMQRFPNLKRLANASVEDILEMWTGLGYYARGRNLHQTAQIISHKYRGRFPQTVDALQALPGIGRSTAGAIAALAFDKPAPILDGNVKRVLCRYYQIAGWPGQSATLNALWELATKHTPNHRPGDYVQAMMDLGATVCSRSQPKCTQCPLQSGCGAHQAGEENRYPTPKPRKTLPVRQSYFLLLANHDGDILLEKKPPIGIWGGLWSFPSCTSEDDLKTWCEKNYGLTLKNLDYWPKFRHTFSHFHLDIQPCHARFKETSHIIHETSDTQWYSLAENKIIACASPVKHLLNALKCQHKI